MNTIPTIGFNVETVTPMPGVTFTVWDVGGQEKIRALWKHYYIGTEGKKTTAKSTAAATTAPITIQQLTYTSASLNSKC